MAPNTLQMLEGFYGVMQIGGIVVPLNTRLIPSDYAYMINHSGVKVLMVDAGLVHLTEPIVEELKGVEHFLLLPVSPEQEREGWMDYEHLLTDASPDSPPVPEMDERDTATILYTSGTTGVPKGVIHSHRSLLRVSDRDTLLYTLPLFHVNGWGTPFSFVGMGATHVMLRKVDPRRIFALIEREQVSVACMAPTVLNMLTYEPYSKTFCAPQHVRVVIAGSAPPPSYIQLVKEELGFEFIQEYGMTEAAPFLTIADIKPHLDGDKEQVHRLKAKTGIGMLNTKVRVIDEEGRDVVPNGKEIGEVVARGNNIMEGYWKQPEETISSFIDGWYRTADMATIDEEGYVKMVDRKKDIIISGGKNISTIEVEGVLYKHPAILEAAVIAIPHEKWGETSHAMCVVKEGHTLTEDELITYSREHLSPSKCQNQFSLSMNYPRPVN